MKCWFLVRGENLMITQGKTSRSRAENQQTRPKHHSGSVNQTNVTLVECECSDNCTNPQVAKITENINEQDIHQKFGKKKWLHKSQLKVIKSSYQDTSACFALLVVKMSSCVDAKVDNFLSLF